MENQTDSSVIPLQMKNQIAIHLPVYEGPLDLLLDLIKKNEINIYDIPVAEITRQYIDYLNQMKEMNLDIAGEFLVMAATLLYIKSKMLLPTDETEEDEDGGDPRAELVRKLLEYQAFREAAKELGLMELDRAKEFTRQISDYYFKDLESEVVDAEPLDANLFDLLQAFHKVLKEVSRENIHEVFEQVISIDQKIEQIRTLFKERDEIYFTDLFDKSITRNELIVSFLAMLEITKQRFVRIYQDSMFDEIRLVKRRD
ncbi:MAG: segregation/condensation protein A [Candidatus Omnitrophica bacterium]|nr:segregation/condensation protein A [Candidatus Omnitrophota bacterium]